jgi:hypothetical protein
MGVTVFYKGKLKSPDLIEPLLEELQSLSSELSWKFDPFSDTDLNLTGANLRLHPEAEALGFFFYPDGRLGNLISAILEKEKPTPADSRYKELDVLHLCWCKTQFADPSIHIMTVELLVYLQNKYFAELEITDDGGYYPDKNEIELMRRMQTIDTTINALGILFEGGELPEDIPEDLKEQLLESHRQLLLLLKLLGNNPYLKETN